MKKQLLLLVIPFFSLSASYSQNQIQGVLKDSDGLPVISATVVIKGTTIHSISDTKGEFKIATDKKLPFTLVISSVGYKSQELEVYELFDEPVELMLREDNVLSEVVVTARRRSETLQEVPVAISVVRGAVVEDAGAFNVNRVKELVPAVQLYSSNPRNTTLNVRGLGSTFGLTNDGIDPGVGFYVDGVYYARPAATTLDFIDVDRIEVLRGPQGTLFGKNTTAGAFNITTKAPSFVPSGTFEVSYGNYGFIQAKTSVTGPINNKLAARVSFSGTQRDGVLYNVSTQQRVNDLNNLGIRGQLLYTPSDNVSVTLAGDATRQRPNGYAQVVAGVAPTQRAPYRQFEQIISDLNYQLPSRDPFDRLIDHNTTWRSGNDLGGISVNVDAKIGEGNLTSTTAWRYWNWDPSNDRDFTALPVLTLSQATSKHQQWTQEIRFAGNINERISGVVGAFLISQDLKTDPYHIEESGAAQARFSKNSTSELWQTPGLFDGYGIRTTSRLKSLGAALFGQLDWTISNSWHILPGIRYNYDRKNVDYNRVTYGGLQTDNPELIALKRVVYTDQSFAADVSESNFSGQITIAYKPTARLNAFGTFSTSYKPVGVNLGGLPTSGGEAMTDLARIKPEYVIHYEAGIKAAPIKNTSLNLTVFDTNIRDYQTQVQTAEVGVNRGYLANAEEVRVIGAELDGNARINKHVSFYGAVTYTDGKYISFTNAPVPLEETGGPTAFKDISGEKLPGISSWAGSLGGELLSNEVTIVGKKTKLFTALDGYFRSSFSSSPSPSRFLNVDGYSLLNARAGFKSTDGLSFFVWTRNLLDKNYFEQLLPAAGNAGHYAAVLGDPRTYGVTLRYTYTK